MEISGPSCAEEYINAFLVPFSRGHRLSREGDRALKLCTLLAFPLPPLDQLSKTLTCCPT